MLETSSNGAEAEQVPAPGEAAPTPRRLKPEQVADRIREMIIQDHLPPGTRIRERSLSEQLQVSRTPLREALKQLAAEGLVELHPNRSAVVASPSEEELHDMLQLLSVLEGFAGELAPGRASDEEIAEIQALHYEMLAAHTRGDRLRYFLLNQRIHLGIVASSKNRELIDQHRRLNARLYRIRYVCNLGTQRWDEATREHATALSRLLREHVFSAWHKLRELVADDKVSLRGPADATPRRLRQESAA
jgi:DNA-binding GntR family transcriptional regulator